MREINELGLVMAVGIDRAKGERFFTVTAQIAKPSDASGQGGKSGGGAEPVWIGSAQGNTIFEAVRNLAKFASRRIMWAHNNIVVIGQDLAEDDVTPVLDFFTHNPELRMKTWVAVAHGKAQDYISAKTGIENIPGISISQLFRYHELPAESVASSMLNFYSDFKSESRQPLISMLTTGRPENKSQIELEGSAAFRGAKMVGMLSPNETRGLAWLRKDTNNAVVSVEGVDEKNNIGIAVEIKSAKVKINSKLSGEIPAFNIQLKVDGAISEEDSSSDMEINDFKNKVETLTSKEISKEIKLGIDKAKELNCDVLGLGRVLHIQHKKEWQSGLQDKWSDVYSQVAIDVNVEVNIHSSSVYQQSIKNEKQKGGLKNEGSNR